MGKHRSFTAEFKAQIVLEIISGAKRSSEICRKHQIKPQLLNQWKKPFSRKRCYTFSGQTAK